LYLAQNNRFWLAILSKLLVRILLGLVAVMTALGLFSFSVMKLSNEVRFDHYWSDVLAPPLRYLIKNNITNLDQAPGGSISVVLQEQVQLSSVYLARVNAGQVVFEEEKGEFKALVSFDPGRLLVFESENTGRGVYSLYQWIISKELDASLNTDNFDLILNQLANQLSEAARKRMISNSKFIVIPARG